MKDTKDAYQMLGVAEGASKDEIIKRYDILLKKHRMLQSLGEKQEINLDEVNKAYNLLMGYNTGETEAYRPSKLNPLYRKLNLDERKTNNFFHYYKIHILVAIVVLIFAVTTIRGCVSRVPEDFYVTFIGKIYTSDVGCLEQKIKENIQSIKQPSVEVITVSEEDKGELSYALNMKAVVAIISENIDFLIMDKYSFEKYAKQGALMSLDDLVPELGIDMGKNADFVLKGEEETESHLYGIDVSSSSLLKDTQISGKEKIATIKVKTKHYESCIEFIKLLLKKN